MIVRSRFVVACAGAGLVGLAAAAAPVAADPYTIGGWIGPRFYSDDSALGFIPSAPEHPMLTNGMVIGARLARRITPWLVPEVELPFSITTTDRFDATVLWLQPRAHVRFEFLPRTTHVQPFLLLGGGAKISVSSKSNVFANDIAGDGYFGIGAHAYTGRGFQIRGDVRMFVGPGVDKTAVLEFEAGIGLWFELGGKGKHRPVDPGDGSPPVDPDPDLDGIALDADACPDRAEDVDDFEDTDGCPDIDNDLDHVLDIADKCATVSESLNGFEDDDGCPDTLPPELDDLDGTVEGVVYSPGETSLNSSGRRTIKKIAKLLAKYPTVKIKLTGHTDDREAAANKPGPDEDPVDPSMAASELSVERAAVIKAMLIALGIRDNRITLEGKGADDPVGDNDNKRGRQANRRVVLTRIVPPQ